MKLLLQLATKPSWTKTHLVSGRVMGATVCRFAIATTWDKNDRRVPAPGVTLNSLTSMNQVTCKTCHKAMDGFAQHGLIDFGWTP